MAGFAGLLLVAAAGGCLSEPHTRKGLKIDYWNESSRNLVLTMEGYEPQHGWVGGQEWGFPPSQSRYPDLPGSGGAGMGCLEGFDDPYSEPNPWRIRVRTLQGQDVWSQSWSDIGCGVEYDFVYRADGSAIFKLVDKDYRIKRDIPIREGTESS